MTVLAVSLRTAAQAGGVEKFVVGAVVHRRGGVLVVRRSELDGFLPGIEGLLSGGVEAGEILVEALDRALLEEVGFGVSAIDDDFLGQFDYLADKAVRGVRAVGRSCSETLRGAHRSPMDRHGGSQRHVLHA